MGNKKSFTNLLGLLTFLIATNALTAATLVQPHSAAPVIAWASDPVRPNETAILSGGNFAADAMIELSRVEQGPPAWTSIKPIQIDDNSAKFIIPADEKMDVFACRIVAGNVTSNTVLINAPDVWWTQGDYGNAASPGGWLRVFGKSLNFGGTSQARLQNDKGEPITLKASTADGYNLTFPIPQSIASGTYTIYIHNGLGGESAWKNAGRIEIKALKPWPTTIYNVKQLGFDAALAKAKENHGGVIYFPRGHYEMKGQIALPPQTILRGQGADLATIFWSTMANPQASLITGTSFGVEDISINVEGYHRNVIEDSPASDGVKIKNVLLRANAFFRLTDIGDMEKDWRGKKVVHPTRENGAAFTIHGSNFQITDCDILATNVGIQITKAHNGLIARNKIRYGIQGLMLESVDGLVVEDNQVTGGHLAASGNCFSTYWSTSAQNVYFARNHLSQMYGYDREAFTFDGAGGAYWGKLAEINSTHMVLAQDPRPRGYIHIQNWSGAAFCIIDGKGVGQYRRVTHNHGRDWEIDRPWDIAPDTNSVISIVPFRGRVLFIGNHLEDAGIVQAYGTSLDCVFAENEFVRSAGITLIGRNPHGWGWQPSWNCQILDNHILAGHDWGASNGDIVACTLNRDEEDAESGGSGKMLEFWGPITRCSILRRNVLENNSSIQVDGTVADSIVENCVIRNADNGIEVTKKPTELLLRKNEFDNVDKPMSGDALEKASVLSN